MNLPKNPYKSPTAERDDALHANRTKSHGVRMLIGFMVCALPPLGAGIYVLLGAPFHHESSATGGFATGAIPLSALLLILIASPLLGIVGAIIARFSKA